MSDHPLPRNVNDVNLEAGRHFKTLQLKNKQKEFLVPGRPSVIGHLHSRIICEHKDFRVEQLSSSYFIFDGFNKVSELSEVG
jgi:hypothetical protein